MNAENKYSLGEGAQKREVKKKQQLNKKHISC